MRNLFSHLVDSIAQLVVKLEKLVMEEEGYHFTAVVRHRFQGLILRLPLVLSRSYSKVDFTSKLPLSNYSSEIYN